ncbi:T9SS type A sorting domain-containing protein [Fodinibius sediminis]|uniref:T9SS type A sorting domain-containing protein n=1 Tax=Fodinibius sediminis TaxID=1214077 RepID=UPI00163DCAA2|nr:T9SS type A sorting domain-containing protein [Fodinibius sediminis]
MGLFLGGKEIAVAQTAGDLAFVGLNTHQNDFAIITLNDLPPGRVLFFTNGKWRGRSFEEERGILRWITPDNVISAGTVVIFEDVRSMRPSVSHGAAEGGGIELTSRDFALYSYSRNRPEQPHLFLTAITNDKSLLEGTGLRAEREAVVIGRGIDYAVYRGERTGGRGGISHRIIADTQNHWLQSTEGASMNIRRDMASLSAAAQAIQRPSSTYVASIDGREGWKGLSSPTVNTAFEHILGDIWKGGADTENSAREGSILTWGEREEAFVYPTDMKNYMEAGRGYFIHVPEDNDLNRGGVPKILSSEGRPHGRYVDIHVTATDANENKRIDGMEGFNLLGNPYSRELSVGAVKEALATANGNMNYYLYVWNPELGNGNGGFEFLTNNEVIAPVQPFWVRYLDSDINGIVRFDRNNLLAEQQRETYYSSNEPTGSFDIRLGADNWYDTYRIELREGARVGEDQWDAYKLFSLNTGSINLFSRVSGSNRLAKNVLPNSLERELEIPLAFSALDKDKLLFQWDTPDELPRDWNLVLVDQKRKREINLRTANRYAFEPETPTIEKAVIPRQQSLLNTQYEAISGERFSLAIRPSGTQEQILSELPESIRLKPNYPNPFTVSTTIPFELDEATDVTLTVWNMIGQKVATLIDNEPRQAGKDHEEDWNAANMPSGMYIARLEAGGEVFTRKMTLIK